MVRGGGARRPEARATVRQWNVTTQSRPSLQFKQRSSFTTLSKLSSLKATTAGPYVSFDGASLEAVCSNDATTTATDTNRITFIEQFAARAFFLQTNCCKEECTMVTLRACGLCVHEFSRVILDMLSQKKLLPV